MNYYHYIVWLNSQEEARYVLQLNGERMQPTGQKSATALTWSQSSHLASRASPSGWSRPHVGYSFSLSSIVSSVPKELMVIMNALLSASNCYKKYAKFLQFLWVKTTNVLVHEEEPSVPLLWCMWITEIIILLCDTSKRLLSCTQWHCGDVKYVENVWLSTWRISPITSAVVPPIS